MDKNKWGPLEIARNTDLLSNLWERCHEGGSRGRGWGTHRAGHNCATPGSNIFLYDGNVVTIIHSKNGDRHAKLIVKTIGDPASSTMPEEVEAILIAAGLLDPESPH